ncbi:MAG: hypothetical protein RR296_13295, partial [Clostridia bacterium]
KFFQFAPVTRVAQIPASNAYAQAIRQAPVDQLQGELRQSCRRGLRRKRAAGLVFSIFSFGKR